MAKLSRKVIGSVLALIFAVSLLLAVEAGAEGKKATPVDGARFDTSFPLKENLNTFMGKDIYVHLRAGKTIQGYVRSVGDHFLHLERLAGKEFFDALVRIDDISAVEARFREMK